MKLIYLDSGTDVKVGDILTKGLNFPLTVTGWQVPFKYGAKGRIYVQTEEGTGAEIFPSVVGAKWVK